ncbi:MAG TPA: hypothetical protein VGM53_15390 [Streptosporangiaceae bacterium]|jgi:hypothetical protein
MLADCDRCALRDIACAECVITVLPDGQAGLGDAERQALRALAAAGMVPPLRFRPARAAAAAQTLEPAAGPACSTGPSGPAGPVTGARPGPRRPAARRSTGRPGRQPVPSHR